MYLMHYIGDGEWMLDLSSTSMEQMGQDDAVPFLATSSELQKHGTHSTHFYLPINNIAMEGAHEILKLTNLAGQSVVLALCCVPINDHSCCFTSALVNFTTSVCGCLPPFWFL